MRARKWGIVRRAWPLFLAICLVVEGRAHAQVSVNYPGAAGTVSSGINDEGTVVGSYFDALYNTHGFIYRHGIFSTLDYPGASETLPRAINNNGVVVGYYKLSTDTPTMVHGFSYSSGLYQSFDYPGADSTMLSGINGVGTIVGKEITYSTTFPFPAEGESFTTRNGITFTIIENSIGFEVSGINDDNVLVGTAFSPAYPLYSIGGIGTSDHLSYYDVPGYITAPWNINNGGVVVGQLASPSGYYMGFVNVNGQFFTQSVPGTQQTIFTGINNLGQIVGYTATPSGTGPDRFSGYSTTVDQVVTEGRRLGEWFYTLPPCRVIDTRLAPGALAGPALQPNEARVFALAGVCGLPNSAGAAAVNITVIGSTAAGSLSIVPADAPVTAASAISFKTGDVRANNGLLKLSLDGTGAVAVYNGSSGTVQLTLDVSGYFQ